MFFSGLIVFTSHQIKQNTRPKLLIDLNNKIHKEYNEEIGRERYHVAKIKQVFPVKLELFRSYDVQPVVNLIDENCTDHQGKDIKNTLNGNDITERHLSKSGTICDSVDTKKQCSKYESG